MRIGWSSMRIRNVVAAMGGAAAAALALGACVGDEPQNGGPADASIATTEAAPGPDSTMPGTDSGGTEVDSSLPGTDAGGADGGTPTDASGSDVLTQADAGADARGDAGQPSDAATDAAPGKCVFGTSLFGDGCTFGP
jgi:hypothetical protein